jgi:hypothetical protein
MAVGDPTRGDAGDGYRTDGQRVERRSGGERRTGWFVTCLEYRRDRRRHMWAYLLVVAVSVLSGYLGYTAGQDSDRNLKQTGADAVFRSCLSRADIRITTADAIDDLRTAALRPPISDAERKAQESFLARTQGPLDDLLSKAVGKPIKTEGWLPSRYLNALRRQAGVRCKEQAEEQFGIKLDAH